MGFTQHCAILEAFYAAVTAADAEAIVALYHPDLRIWHNNDGSVDTIAASIPRILSMHHLADDIRYEEVRRAELGDGRVLQQHVLRMTARDGTVIEVPTAIVVTFTDDKIRTIEAYLDPTPLNALARR